MKKELLRRRADIFFIVLLLVLSWYAWRMLPEIVIRSDGFAHMLDSEQQQFWSKQTRLTGIEVGATILGVILPKLFGPHVSYYLWFELGTILFISALFYLLVRVVSGSSVIAFASALIASVNYFGNWDNYGTHCYCFFMERVANMVVMIPSFIFLHLFLKFQKKRFYIISLLLYFIGVKLGHIELLLTPLFMFYPLFWFLVGTSKGQFFKGVFLSASFGAVSIIIFLLQRVSYRFIEPQISLFEFVLHPEKNNYFIAAGLQLAFWSQYQPILPYLSKESYLFRFFSIENAMNSIIYFVITYILFFVMLYRYLPRFRPLLLTCLAGVVAIFILNYYVKHDEILVYGSNRYLYFPTFLLSIFLGLVIWFLFLKRKSLAFFIGIFILIAYYYVNVVLLEDTFRQEFIWSKSTKAFFEHIIKTRDSLSSNTLVVLPRPEFWMQEEEFFTAHLGKGNVRYISENNGYVDWRTVASSSAHVIKLSYDTKCHCVRETKIE